MNSEHPKEPLTERSETLSAHRQTTDKLRTRPSNGAYVEHWVWGTTQVLNELLSTEWPNEPLWKKKKKDKLAFSVYKEGHNLQRRLSMHFEKTKDLLNHCFVLLTDLQTMVVSTDEEKLQQAEVCRLLPCFLVLHLGLPHLNKVQKWMLPQVKHYTSFEQETVGSSFLLSVAFLCLSTPTEALLHLVGAVSFSATKRRQCVTTAIQQESPNHPLWECKWFGGKRRKTKDLGVTESQEKS